VSAERREQSWTTRLMVLSLTAAVAVSVIYLPQSMLTEVATDLGVSPGLASVAATTVQAGYALGILLLVPLADRIQPRRQVTVQSLLLAAALAGSALMPGIISVALGFLVVGLVANIAQLIIPAANRLSPPDQRGTTMSSLIGALLIGIFGGRIVASLLVDAWGWRWVVLAFAALVLAMVPLVRRALDADLEMTAASRSYGRLLLSTLVLARHSPVLVQSAVMQFFVFATFNSVWTVMVLHLTSAPFHWSVRSAGLFGLVGLAAGVVTPVSGRFIDRFGPLPVSGAFLALLLVSTASTIVDSTVIIAFAVSMFLATWANQSIQSANQGRVLAANSGASAQANTLFMFFVFLGGSAGAFLGPLAYFAGGMTRVAEQATAFVVCAGLAWLVTVRSERRSRAPQVERARVTA
jgi:predicted MFS family arabinose efflux permease